ncbi:unnamed protein product [Lupinus luteus]|uniref:Uncharacterized protein n=1 Tax=Lupinus luteus TaxID=3873 RepID=A0AAV1W0L6_LUPLU
MTKLTSVQIFTVFLLLTGIFMTSEVVAIPKTCHIVLYPRGCDLQTCRLDCYTKFEGKGDCIITGEPKFNKCICAYYC